MPPPVRGRERLGQKPSGLLQRTACGSRCQQGGGGRRNTPSVRFMYILVDYYKIRYRAFTFVVELLVVIWMVDDACLLCP